MSAGADDVLAVILARGLGSRMRETDAGAAVSLTAAQEAAASAGHKGLMPIGEHGGRSRPFLDYVLSGLADAGFRDVVLVVAPEHEQVRAHYDGVHAPRRVSLHYAVQAEPIGTANAVLAAEPVVAARPFVVLNSDNLYPLAALRAMRALRGPGLPAFERDELVRTSGIPAERLASFALLTVSAAGTLVDIIEKPGAATMDAAGPHALVSMNCWRFDARIFEACRDAPRSARGEYELPEAVRLAVGRGVTFEVVRSRGPVLDLSRRADVPFVARELQRVSVTL